ncbi:MAG: DegV family protein [Lachnospirales bacterium]
MIKILADSSCDVLDYFEGPDFTPFESIPLTITVDGRDFVDTRDIDVDEFLEVMENSKEGSRSSAPSPDDFLKAFGDADEIYVVCMSSKISGTFNVANVAKQMYEEANPGKKVQVFDTLVATAPATLIVSKIDEFIKQGLSMEEVTKKTFDAIERVNFYFILERFDNLVRNGRINPYIAKFASTLSIKPICHGVNGEISLLEKARGMKAYTKLVNLLYEKERENVENGCSFSVVLTHVRCMDKALHVRKLIEEKFKVRDFHIAEPTALCANYGDRGGILIGLIANI